MKKITSALLAILLGSATIALTANSASANTTTPIKNVPLNESLYPGKDLPYTKTISVGSGSNIRAIGILTDWWYKRPTKIRVYEWNGRKGKLVGYTQFSSYLKNVCGPQYNRECKWSPEDKSSSEAQLIVPINSVVRTNSIIVEIDGLLDPANKFVLLKGIKVYGKRVNQQRGYVTFFHQGGYVAKFEVSWDEPKKPRQIWRSGNKTAGWKKTVRFPGNATNFSIKATAYTGVIWQPENEIINVREAKIPNKCYKVFGTTLSTAYDNNCR